METSDLKSIENTRDSEHESPCSWRKQLGRRQPPPKCVEIKKLMKALRSFHQHYLPLLLSLYNCFYDDDGDDSLHDLSHPQGRVSLDPKSRNADANCRHLNQPAFPQIQTLMLMGMWDALALATRNQVRLGRSGSDQIDQSSLRPQKSVPNQLSTECQRDQYQPLAGSHDPSSLSNGPSPMMSPPAAPCLLLPTNHVTMGMLLRTRSANVGWGGRASEMGLSTAFFTLMCVMYCESEPFWTA